MPIPRQEKIVFLSAAAWDNRAKYWLSLPTIEQELVGLAVRRRAALKKESNEA